LYCVKKYLPSGKTLFDFIGWLFKKHNLSEKNFKNLISFFVHSLSDNRQLFEEARIYDIFNFFFGQIRKYD